MRRRCRSAPLNPAPRKFFVQCPCHRESPASEAEYIHVIIFQPLAGRMSIVTEPRAHPARLIGTYGGAHAAASHSHTTFHVSTAHSAGKGYRKIRVVIVGAIYLVTKIDDVVSFCRQ